MENHEYYLFLKISIYFYNKIQLSQLVLILTNIKTNYFWNIRKQEIVNAMNFVPSQLFSYLQYLQDYCFHLGLNLNKGLCGPKTATLEFWKGLVETKGKKNKVISYTQFPIQAPSGPTYCRVWLDNKNTCVHLFKQGVRCFWSETSSPSYAMTVCCTFWMKGILQYHKLLVFYWSAKLVFWPVD